MAQQAPSPLYDAYATRRKMFTDLEHKKAAVRKARQLWELASTGRAGNKYTTFNERSAAMALFMATREYEAAQTKYSAQDKLVFITHALYGTYALQTVSAQS